MLLKGWEPASIREEQLSDENTGIIMTALECGDKKTSMGKHIQKSYTNQDTLGSMGQVTNPWRYDVQEMGE